MRLLVRVGLVVVSLVAVMVAALAVFLPRIADSEAVQTRLGAAARQSLGREVSWEALRVGLLPPRLALSEPRVAGARAGEPAALEARSVDLRLELLPLLLRSVVVDSLVVEGVTLRLTRTAQGFELPIEPPAPAAAGAPSRPGGQAATPTSAEPSPLRLAIRSLRLVDSSLILEDRSLPRPVTWTVTGLSGSASADSLDGPIEVEARGQAEGGTFALRATGSLAGAFEFSADLDRVGIDRASPYLDGAGTVAGRVSGRLGGALGDSPRIDADVKLLEAVVQTPDAALRGDVALRMDHKGGLVKGSGSFSLDATQAEVRYGEAFAKPRGKALTASGRLVPDGKGGLAAEGVALRLDNLAGTAAFRATPRVRAELTAPPFAVDGWDALLPALADYKPTGQVELVGLVLQTAPVEMRGQVRVPRLRLELPERGAVDLAGALVGRGASLESDGLEATLAGQKIPLSVALSGFDSSPRYRVEARAEGADVDALLGALADMKGTLSGPLTASTDLSGPIGGERAPLEALSGRARLEIGKGRLRGISLLRGTFDRLGAFGEAAVLFGAARGGKTLQRFYDDEFQSITGTFQIAGGRARTQDLRLVYRDYTADLHGTLGLLDAALDFAGTLTIGEDVTTALAQNATDGTQAAPATTRRERVIPLARVAGTLSAPRVEITRETAVAFASGFALARQRGELEQKIDERLGEGAGRDVLDTLEGILGRRRPPSQQP